MGKPHHSVSHKSNPSTLRSGAEESQLNLSAPEVVGIVFDGFPRIGSHRIFVVIFVGQLHMKSRVNLHEAGKADL